MGILLSINAERFNQDFQELARIGALPGGGISRPAFSPAHQQARAWYRERAEEAGLSVHVDGAGNHFARLDCGPQDAPALLLGSHLDSVESGGRYDGALGVLAGLEALRCVQDSGLHLPFNLEAVDFTDEEGSLVSFLGSFALCGKLAECDLENPRGGVQALEAGLEAAGLSKAGVLAAVRDQKSVAGYLELHIEQGPQLEEYGAPVGLVTQISGIAFFRLTFKGAAGHAGTLPMAVRRDAAHGAAEFVLALRRRMLVNFPECFANVGRIELEPGAFNTIPQRAALALELRAADMAEFNRLENELLVEAEAAAEKYALGLEVEALGRREPVRMHPAFQNAIRRAASALRLDTIPLISRAGHDAQAIAECWPAGMIFVPSVEGISHSPHELTDWGDCLNGANVLANTVIQLAGAFPWEQMPLALPR